MAYRVSSQINNPTDIVKSKFSSCDEKENWIFFRMEWRRRELSEVTFWKHCPKIWQSYRLYFGNTLTTTLISHKTTDPRIHRTRRKTRKPAKMVKNGGPVAAASVLLSSDFSFPESPPDGLVFDAKIKGNMSFGCNLGVVFNLHIKCLSGSEN